MVPCGTDPAGARDVRARSRTRRLAGSTTAEHGTAAGAEPELGACADPSLRDLSFADWKAILVRAGKEFMNDNAMMLASALAYSSFFAIPSVLLVTVGLFTLVAGPGHDHDADAALRHGDAGAGDRAARRAR